MATRWRMPPDSWAGRAFSKPVNPTKRSGAVARRTVRCARRDDSSSPQRRAAAHLDGANYDHPARDPFDRRSSIPCRHDRAAVTQAIPRQSVIELDFPRLRTSGFVAHTRVPLRCGSRGRIVVRPLSATTSRWTDVDRRRSPFSSPRRWPSWRESDRLWSAVGLVITILLWQLLAWGPLDRYLPTPLSIACAGLHGRHSALLAASGQYPGDRRARPSAGRAISGNIAAATSAHPGRARAAVAIPRLEAAAARVRDRDVHDSSDRVARSDRFSKSPSAATCPTPCSPVSQCSSPRTSAPFSALRSADRAVFL